MYNLKPPSPSSVHVICNQSGLDEADSMILYFSLFFCTWRIDKSKNKGNITVEVDFMHNIIYVAMEKAHPTYKLSNETVVVH